MVKAKVPTEHQEQCAIFQYAKLKANQDSRWTMLVAIPNAGGRGKDNIIRGKLLSAEGMAKGFPDMFLAVPCGTYCGLLIELKREKGGQVSSEQRAWINALRERGYCAEVCRGANQAIATIEAYLGLGYIIQ